MSSENEDDMMVEGLSEDGLGDYFGEEGDEEESQEARTGAATKESQLEGVEKQNDSLMANDFKEFLGFCATAGGKIDPKITRELLLKDEVSAKGSVASAEVERIVKMDAMELTTLISTLKNSIMGMRVKLAQIMEHLAESETDPKESISLINLRIEILAEYWSYLSLLVIMKVIYFNQAQR